MPQNDSRFELERGTGDLIDLLNDQDGEFYEDDHFELEDDWARLFSFQKNPQIESDVSDYTDKDAEEMFGIVLEYRNGEFILELIESSEDWEEICEEIKDGSLQVEGKIWKDKISPLVQKFQMEKARRMVEATVKTLLGKE